MPMEEEMEQQDRPMQQPTLAPHPGTMAEAQVTDGMEIVTLRATLADLHAQFAQYRKVRTRWHQP